MGGHVELLDADVVIRCDAMGASGPLKLEAVQRRFEQLMEEEGEMKEGDNGDGPTLANFVRNACNPSSHQKNR